MTQRQSQVNVLSIKQFAQICRTTPRTLRFYEKLGLLLPSHINPFTKYRSYTPEQAREFLQIKLLQDFQMPLKKIQLTISQKAIQQTVNKQLNQIKQTIAEKQKEYSFLQTINHFLFGKLAINSYLKKESVGPFSLFSLHVSHGDYDKVPQYLETLRETAQQLRLQTTHDEFLFYGATTYLPKHSMLDVAVLCKPTSTKHMLPAGYSIKTFPKTKALVFTYTGPYEYLTLIYPKLFDYLVEKEIEISGQVFDWYISHPNTTSSQFEYITKLVFPIK
ncbi:MAG: MerR family transcriptional regulator [Patescibacteria group bacterium]|nr:MerR family transcriptional regulator [Patescibacteria group bacterium]MDE2589240.1 MerR family transcriptional regulator [Patescibacteria group bacterium]